MYHTNSRKRITERRRQNEKDKWIKEVEVEGSKRTYQITSKGMDAYEQEVQRLQSCVKDALDAKMDG